MQAWVMDKLSGISDLVLRDVPEPVAGAGEVVLAVQLAALNPADAYLAEGQYPARPPLPHVLGRDGLGKVVAVGAGVTAFAVGDTGLLLRGEVGVNRWGTLAQRVSVPVESLTRVPAGWTAEQAAGAPLVYMTAYQALTQWDERVGAKGVVLVTGASGGVGIASMQLAKAMGHRVVAMTRSPGKIGALKDLGADFAWSSDDTQWRKSLIGALGGRKVNLVVDNIGGGQFSEVLDTLDMNGCVSVVGRLAGPVPSFNTASLFFRRLRIGGVAVGTYSAAETQSVWEKVVALLGSIGARPVVDSHWPFARVPEAFAKLAAGPLGKVLIDVGV